MRQLSRQFPDRTDERIHDLQVLSTTPESMKPKSTLLPRVMLGFEEAESPDSMSRGKSKRQSVEFANRLSNKAFSLHDQLVNVRGRRKYLAMEWFDGSIAVAIEKCRSKQALFLVYIYNVGEKQTDNDVQFNKVLEDVDTDQFDVNFIAIRLKTGTEDATHFANIYPTPVVPALYVIGKAGTPLKVLTAVNGITMERFVEEFQKTVEEFHKTIEGEKPQKILKESRNGADDLDGRQMTLEEKQKRAMELLAQKKAQKEQEELEEAKKKELERRKDGQAMLKAREEQKDREVLEAMEQRRREKAENEAQLKRLREQIRMDREERAKRAHIEPAAAPAPAPVMKPIPTDHCRIQVKFANGSTLVKQLSSAEPLQVVVDAIKEDGRQPSPFYLVQMYPRTELTDFDKTLLDLGLTPSATILAVPGPGRMGVVAQEAEAPVEAVAE
uniref:UBX domain-containing protein 4 n=1 Tax=Steinernema glaseri TaxID=37863 RepID=A0A1I7ZDE7_9BILA